MQQWQEAVRGQNADPQRLSAAGGDDDIQRAA